MILECDHSWKHSTNLWESCWVLKPGWKHLYDTVFVDVIWFDLALPDSKTTLGGCGVWELGMSSTEPYIMGQLIRLIPLKYMLSYWSIMHMKEMFQKSHEVPLLFPTAWVKSQVSIGRGRGAARLPRKDVLQDRGSYEKGTLPKSHKTTTFQGKNLDSAY